MNVYWDVDVDNDRENPTPGWQPYCYEEHGIVMFSIEMWFRSDVDAKEWVLANLVNATHFWGPS